MDALTWFKSVFQRALATPAPSRVDMATEQWADVPLHLAAARLRPPVAPADGDDDWDALIARAKIQAASPNAPSPPPPPPHPLPRAPSPPPPPPARRASPRANPELVAWGRAKRS